MSKEEYLSQLRDNLQTLNLDEQNEAIQYYYDYFEDSGFDEEKVISELGTPEEVAAKIREELSNALVINEKQSEKDSSESEESSENENYRTSLYYVFESSEVKNVNFDFAAVEVICVSGKKFSVETRDILRENFECRMENGTLICKNINQFQNFTFFARARNSSVVPRVLITVPEETKLDNCKVKIGAGRFETQQINLSCEKGSVEVGAGNCVIKGLNGKNMSLHCGMGNINIFGEVKGLTNIDCGMGNVKLDLKGDASAYSFDSKVGLGSIDVNNEKRGGFGQDYSQPKKENHFSINCGMGNVKVLINK